MPSTTVHVSSELLAQVDEAARQRGISRNRFVVIALEEALRREPGEWPPRFFENPFGADDRRILNEAAREMETAILRNRRSRTGAPL